MMRTWRPKSMRRRSLWSSRASPTAAPPSACWRHSGESSGGRPASEREAGRWPRSCFCLRSARNSRPRRLIYRARQTCIGTTWAAPRPASRSTAATAKRVPRQILRCEHAGGARGRPPRLTRGETAEFNDLRREPDQFGLRRPDTTAYGRDPRRRQVGLAQASGADASSASTSVVRGGRARNSVIRGCSWTTSAGLSDLGRSILHIYLAAIGYGVLGTTLAILLRSPAVAIAVGVAYTLPGEAIVSSVCEGGERWLPAQLLSALAPGGTSSISYP
jgi:hypothetical protein